VSDSSRPLPVYAERGRAQQLLVHAEKVAVFEGDEYFRSPHVLEAAASYTGSDPGHVPAGHVEGLTLATSRRAMSRV
jgi:hypothetical protein